MSIQETILETFIYSDGNLFWKVKSGRQAAGSLAGCKQGPNGYWVVSVNRRLHRRSRVIWMYHHGDIPPGMIIDHINRDKTDDRIENLRLTTRRGNQHNLSNQSKYGIGVTRGKTGAGNLRNKFSANIFKDGRNVWIGSFKTPEEAREAYLRELDKLNA